MKKRGRPKTRNEENIWLENMYSNKKFSNTRKDGFKNITKNEFINWFDQKEYDKGCYYCGTTHETSKKIYDFQTVTKGRLDATRGEKRMHRLELERRDPSDSYDNLENLAWACHWCNNAKSNFFTEAEFHPTISLAIKNVIDKISKEIDDLTNK